MAFTNAMSSFLRKEEVKCSVEGMQFSVVAYWLLFLFLEVAFFRGKGLRLFDSGESRTIKRDTASYEGGRDGVRNIGGIRIFRLSRVKLTAHLLTHLT